MANYPGFFTLADSTALPESGIEPERATNGALKHRRLWPGDKVSFEIGHVLNAADLATLVAFYATNKDLDVTYRWPGDGQTYTVRFAAPPRYTRRTTRWEVRVRLAEV
jgi:hypothetical protein